MSLTEEFLAQISMAEQIFSTSTAKEVTFKLPISVEYFDLFARFFPDKSISILDSCEGQFVDFDADYLFLLTEEGGFYSVNNSDGWSSLLGVKFTASQFIQKLELVCKIAKANSDHDDIHEFFKRH